MNQIRSTIREIVDELAKDGKRTSPAAIEHLVVLRHADMISDFAEHLARQRVRGIARELLTADAKSGQQSIEGLDLPRWITLPDAEGDFVHVPMRVATMGEYETYIEGVLRANVTAATNELDKHISQHRTLSTGPGVDADTLVVDAVEALS